MHCTHSFTYAVPDDHIIPEFTCYSCRNRGYSGYQCEICRAIVCRICVLSDGQSCMQRRNERTSEVDAGLERYQVEKERTFSGFGKGS